MTEPRFKKGDPVRISPDAKHLYRGCTGVVAVVYGPPYFGYKVVLDGNNLTMPQICNEGVLEAVEEKEAKGAPDS